MYSHAQRAATIGQDHGDAAKGAAVGGVALYNPENRQLSLFGFTSLRRYRPLVDLNCEIIIFVWYLARVIPRLRDGAGEGFH